MYAMADLVCRYSATYS